MKLIGESLEAAYEKNGVVYSAFQRRELVQFWENENGEIAVKVRKLTKSEYSSRIKAFKEWQKYAIEEGWLEIDENGRQTWLKK